MNIHSGYRKLNDYKGASCGQHSALSTQHSALSTQHSALSTKLKIILLFALVFLTTNASWANHRITAEPTSFLLMLSSALGISANTSSPDAGCSVITAGYMTRLSSYNTSNTTYTLNLRSVTKYVYPYNNSAFLTDWWDCEIDTYINGVLSSKGGVANGNNQGGVLTMWACPDGFYGENNGNPQSPGICAKYDLNVIHQDNGKTLTLTPAPNQKDPRPLKAEGNDGKSTYELIAKVMEGSTPKAGVAVTFAVEVEPNTGGHDHHDASRPKGFVNGALTASGKTEANGEIKVTFQASQIAGTHVVAAVCESCTNKSVTKNVDVKVPDLVDLLTLPFRTSQWNPVGIGDTPKHRDNHYLTSAAIYRLLEISSKYQKIWPTAPKLTLNDASIKWGGKFDIGGTWDRSKDRHAEHRIGDNIDIRANGNIGSVPANIRLAVKRWLQNKSTDEDNISEELSIESVNPLHEGIGEENEHFHLRLGN